MQIIEITGATGTGPYDIYLCDITLTYCFLISGSTIIPPTVSFELPSSLPNPFPPPANISFDGAESVIVKLVDTSSGCEKFIYYGCPVSPTPTPTMTPTPTPTPTSTCRCLTINNSTMSTGYFYYTDCNGFQTMTYSIPSGITLYYCGSNPVVVSDCTITLGGVCIGNITCP
jgi:hypothetical protein